MEVLAAVRDVAIVVIAVETIVIGVAVLIVVLQAWKLLRLVRGQVERLGNIAGDILGTSAQTARTAKATADFVSERTARPIIEVYSAISGAARFAQAIFGRGNRRGGGQ